jgi:hypothetical protein
MKLFVSNIGWGSALSSLVNTAPIPVAPPAPLPQPMKSNSGPARSQAAGESAFKGQLQDVIHERKGRNGTKDTKQGDAGKQDSPPPITVALVQPTPPPPPAAAFGLPSAGVEAGSNTDSGSSQISAVEQAPADTPTPDTSAALSANPPTPPPQTGQPHNKTNLAFALRLADQQPEPKMDPTFVPPAEPPVIATQQPVLPAPTTSPQNADSVLATPIKTVQPPQQPAAVATPVTAIAPARQGATRESGSHSSDSGAPGKETAQHSQPQLAADPKSFRQASATSEPVSSVPKVTPLQTSSSAVTVSAPAPIVSPAPESPATVAAPIAVERVAVPPAAPNPISHVTDVSVNIQVPRADASGDDRVAIRMLQKGAEIHVSVRTPYTQLAQSLRQDLGKLTTGLDQGGFRTETWRPVAANAAGQSNANPQHQSPDSPNGDGAGSNARSGGNSGQGAGEQKRRQQDDRPRWVAELEQQKNP